MSISDIVPGFSGGIALTITGALQKVWSTQDKILHPKAKGDRIKGILFYVVFILGSLTGVFGFSQVIKLMLENIPTITFWFFLTLSVCSLFIFSRFNKVNIKDMNINYDKRKRTTHSKRVIGFIVGFVVIISICAITFSLRGAQTVEDLKNAKADEIGKPENYLLMYAAGFLGASAMVTPGVSGALIILLFGVYGDIYSELYVHPFDHIWILIIYMLVGVLGTLTSMTVLDKLYKKHTLLMKWIFFGTIAASIIGMLWMFHQMYVPEDPIRWIYIVIAIGAAIALSISVIKIRKRREIIEQQESEKSQ